VVGIIGRRETLIEKENVELLSERKLINISLKKDDKMCQK